MHDEEQQAENLSAMSFGHKCSSFDLNEDCCHDEISSTEEGDEIDNRNDGRRERQYIRSKSPRLRWTHDMHLSFVSNSKVGSSIDECEGTWHCTSLSQANDFCCNPNQIHGKIGPIKALAGRFLKTRGGILLKEYVYSTRPYEGNLGNKHHSLNRDKPLKDREWLPDLQLSLSRRIGLFDDGKSSYYKDTQEISTQISLS
ncbi:hypothetical protein F3Y22_tig00013285pilonHSYRG00172 [Hibiscus syriacus]|uniref:Uncharacterized protein n=1 Tax=Hibiscus syriacus TaxID=106335 RepID=A0A6A3C5Z2_HIBSY|nr:hypothetical protein F3Y22_tig00013285pilonHSYRG00172 [Hibiscus syriacus]